MRALPDQPTEKEYPREEWIDQGDREEALDPNRRQKKEQSQEEKKDEVMKEQNPEEEVRREAHSFRVEHCSHRTAATQDQTGDYVNYEISFA